MGIVDTSKTRSIPTCFDSSFYLQSVDKLYHTHLEDQIMEVTIPEDQIMEVTMPADQIMEAMGTGMEMLEMEMVIIMLEAIMVMETMVITMVMEIQEVMDLAMEKNDKLF